MTSIVQRNGIGPRAELTGFVGRRTELAGIRRSLGATRLLTLTGPGGVGKTRLALRAAAAVERSFADGVRVVELGEVSDPAQVLPAVCAVFGVPEADLDAFVAGTHLLVVLDNCEHLLNASAVVAERLLRASRVVHVLATSRQPMGLAGERTIPLSALAVPHRLAGTRPEILDQYDGVTLFVARAKASVPGFEVTTDNCALIVQLCRRLDGIPLALELAAAQLRAFSLPQLLALTGNQLARLTTGNRSGPPRQQSVLSMLDWSHRLCTRHERTLWARLSVFNGDFDLAAAQAVCADDDPAVVADGIEALVDKSIVLRTDRAGHGRFRLFETAREYGRRGAEGDRELYRRHMSWCLRTDAPDEDLRAALEFSLGDGDGECSVELAGTLCARRWAFGAAREGRPLLARVLRQAPASAKARWLGAWLAIRQGDARTARSQLDACREIAEPVGDQHALACATEFDGLAALFAGDPALAVARLTEAMEQHRRIGSDPRRTAAHLLEARCFAGHRPRGNSRALVPHGYLSWYEAVVNAVNGDPHAAAVPAAEALRSGVADGDQQLTSLCLETIGWSSAAVGDDDRAARLLGAAAAARAEAGIELSGLRHLHPQHDATVRPARRNLGDELFESAYRAGMRMTAEDAAAHAAPPAPAIPTPRRASAAPSRSPLTRRELEIARLVADGLGNKEIAAKLVIAQRTAETHVGHILAKLGFTSRSQIAAWVSEHAAQPVT